MFLYSHMHVVAADVLAKILEKRGSQCFKKIEDRSKMTLHCHT